MMVKRKQDSAVDESLADQEICKSDATVMELGLTAGSMLDEIWARLDIFKSLL